jgi:hypothetical protein
MSYFSKFSFFLQAGCNAKGLGQDCAEFYPEVQQNLKIKTAQSICTVS